MADQRPPRPPRLRTTCVYLALAAGFYVIQSVVVLLSWYGSGEDSVRRFTDPLVDEGMARGDAETLYRLYLGVLALLAGVTVIFAIYTALGHAVSRILLTITAPLMAATALVELSFVSVLFVVLVTMLVRMLWAEDVRRWFALLAGKEPAPARTPVPAAPGPVPPDTPGAPQPQAYAHPVQPQSRRPQDWVRIWALVTLICSSVVALGCTAYLLLYEFSREQLVRQQLESGVNWMDLTEAEIRDSLADLAVASWVGLALALAAAAVSAVVLVRRRRA